MTKPIKIIAGDTITAGDFTFTLSGASGVQNLTDSTVVLHQRKKTAAPDVAQSTTPMTFVGDPEDGKVTFAMTAEETAALSRGEHVLQIEVTFDDGTIKTWPSADEAALLMRVEEGLDAA